MAYLTRMAYLTLEGELAESRYWLEQAKETCTDILKHNLVLNYDRASQAEKLIAEAYEKINAASEILKPDFLADQAKK